MQLPPATDLSARIEPRQRSGYDAEQWNSDEEERGQFSADTAAAAAGSGGRCAGWSRSDDVVGGRVLGQHRHGRAAGLVARGRLGRAHRSAVLERRRPLRRHVVMSAATPVVVGSTLSRRGTLLTRGRPRRFRRRWRRHCRSTRQRPGRRGRSADRRRREGEAAGAAVSSGRRPSVSGRRRRRLDAVDIQPARRRASRDHSISRRRDCLGLARSD